ncbi:MAG TPA: hypothetical protein VKX45_03345 [Bryobacteraceae bacterium]|jgi:hypothetical protein|nr:hypothetical protein [Bryobacteraceae bacterium]
MSISLIALAVVVLGLLIAGAVFLVVKPRRKRAMDLAMRNYVRRHYWT